MNGHFERSHPAVCRSGAYDTVEDLLLLPLAVPEHWTEATTWDAIGAPAVANVPDRLARFHTGRKVLAQLSGPEQALSADEIARRCGLERRHVSNALATLSRNGLVRHTNSACSRDYRWYTGDNPCQA